MDLKQIFQTFYQQCDIKKEIEEHSVMLNNENKGISMINNETIEQLIQYLMMKAFSKGAETSLEMLKKSTKFDEKLAQA
jgi:hypothetical protein